MEQEDAVIRLRSWGGKSQDLVGEKEWCEWWWGGEGGGRQAEEAPLCCLLTHFATGSCIRTTDGSYASGGRAPPHDDDLTDSSFEL